MYLTLLNDTATAVRNACAPSRIHVVSYMAFPIVMKIELLMLLLLPLLSYRIRDIQASSPWWKASPHARRVCFRTLAPTPTPAPNGKYLKAWFSGKRSFLNDPSLAKYDEKRSNSDEWRRATAKEVASLPSSEWECLSRELYLCFFSLRNAFRQERGNCVTRE